MSILALDIGFNCTGYVFITPYSDGSVEFEDVGWIAYKKPSKKRDIRKSNVLVDQAQFVYREMLEQALKSEGMIIEAPHGGAQSGNAMRAMGMVLAIAASVAEQTKRPTEWMVPDDCKISVCGRRDVSKGQIQNKLQQLYPGIVPWVPVKRDGSVNAGKWEHVADALAAYHCAHNGTLVRLLTKEKESSTVSLF